jgi:transketolase
MPGLTVLRPADANETIQAYRFAIEQTERPVVMVLTRQKLPTLPGTAEKAQDGITKGAYGKQRESAAQLLNRCQN